MHDLGNNKTIHVRACSCSTDRDEYPQNENDAMMMQGNEKI